MTRRRAMAALVLVCLVWGVSFTVIKQALGYASPLVLLGLRFTLASAVIVGSLRGLTRDEAAGGLLLGTLAAAAPALEGSESGYRDQAVV